MKDEWIKALQAAVEDSKLDRFPSAIARLNDMADLYPSMVQVLVQRGRARWEMRDWPGAMEDFHRAYLMDPNNPDIAWTISLMHLQQGNFAEGYKTFEERWNSKKFDSARLHTTQPRWKSGAGFQDVLIWSEQGVGDQILYCSLLERVKAQEVTVMLDARLIPLMKRSFRGINFIPQNARVSEIDSQIPMASLVPEFIHGLEDIPGKAFLKANWYRGQELKGCLNLKEGERLVGLSWISGAPRIGNHKSIALDDLLPVLQTPNVRFVSLQYNNDHYEDLYRLEKSHGIRVEIVPEVDNTQDLDGLASLISICDSVVTVSNVTGHIAGGLGVPTQLLDSNKLWYWNNRRGNRNCWYPSVKTYRRPNVIDPWCVDDVARDLKGLLFPAHEPTFVFMRVGDTTQAQRLVESLKETNPLARIIMCTDKKTPEVAGVERFEVDADPTKLMEFRLKAFADLGLDYPAMYLDDDMEVCAEIYPDLLLEDRRVLFCERSFGRDYVFNHQFRSLDFSEYENKTMMEVFPILACATITCDHSVWRELLFIMDHIDPKYREWYGDQEAMKIFVQSVDSGRYGFLQESEYACLPEHAKDPKIIHYKGNRK